MTDYEYPEGYGRCIMCGADRKEPCVTISGGEDEGSKRGGRRDHPHGGRALIGSSQEPAEGFVPVASEPGYIGIVGKPSDMLGITPPEAPEPPARTDASVSADLAKMGDGATGVAPADDGMPPFIDSSYARGTRNGRELAHWIVGRMSEFSAAPAVHIRLPAEHLGAVAAVLMEQGFALSSFSGNGRELTIEVSGLGRVATLETAYKAWQASPATDG